MNVRDVQPATACPAHLGRTRPKMGVVIYPQSEYSHPMGSNIGNTVIETESFIKQAVAAKAGIKAKQKEK